MKGKPKRHNLFLVSSSTTQVPQLQDKKRYQGIKTCEESKTQWYLSDWSA